MVLGVDRVSREGMAGMSAAPPRRTAVLHVLPQDLNRGAQVYAGKLRDGLRGDEHQEHILVTLFRGPIGGARADIMLGVRSGISRKLLDVRAVLNLRRTILRRKVDVIVAHGGEALKYVIATATGRATVYYKIGLSTNEINRPFHKLLYKLLSGRASLVVGNSIAILDQVTELFGIPQSRQRLIPNARDSKVFRPLTDGEVRAEPPRVIFIGQLESGKQPDLFLEVVRALRQRGVIFDAVMVGDGPLRTALEGHASEIGVQLWGIRSDVPELLRKSAIVVVTSAVDTEGMPGVLIEAGLSGIPAVSTGAAGASEVIDDGRTGWVLQGSNPELFADRIETLLADPGLRQAQGVAARSRCLEYFSLEATVRLWHDLVAGIGDLTSVEESRSRTKRAESDG